MIFGKTEVLENLGIFVTPHKSTSNTISRPKRTRKKNNPKRTKNTDESKIMKNERSNDLQIEISQN